VLQCILSKRLTDVTLVPIVEGHAEVHSVPVLMRRLGIDVARPFRVKRYQVVNSGLNGIRSSSRESWSGLSHSQ
jgi:hypothetical protein